MVRKADAQTLAADVYRQLRSAIVNGRFEAGERLLPADLAARYQVSPTVVREALMRLTEQRLAVATPNRGHHVAHMTLQDMHELVEVRVINETAALRLSIERGDLAWEGAVLSALHQLNARDPVRDRDGWFDSHRAFHHALLAACGNGRLLTNCDALLEVGDLYLRWSRTEIVATAPQSEAERAVVRDVVGEHTAIAEATLARDADLATAHYRVHLQRTEQLTADAIDALSP